MEFFGEFEGGGSRCFFTLGALSVLRKEGVTFCDLAGVSAGSVSALLVYCDAVDDMLCALPYIERSVGLLLKRGIDVSDVYTFLNELIALLDLSLPERFSARAATLDAPRLFAGVTSVDGKRQWLQNTDSFDDCLRAIGASCTMPGYSKPVCIEGKYYVDGAVYEGFCLDIAMQLHTNAQHLAIFTSPRNFQLDETAASGQWCQSTISDLQHCTQTRAGRYNATRKAYKNLEREGSAWCIFPPDILDVSVLEYRADVLAHAVEVGKQAAYDCLRRVS